MKRISRRSCSGRLLLLVLLFFHLLVMEKGVFAVTVSDAEKARAQRWIAAKFQATPEVIPGQRDELGRAET